MSKLVSIELTNMKEVNRSFRQYGNKAVNAIRKAVLRTGLAAETDGKMRLNGELGSGRHWVTGRLGTSVHMETKEKNTFKAVENSKAKDGRLNVPVEDLEAVVGSNVEYGPKIEFDYDSFIRWAGENQEGKFPKRVTEELNKIK